MKIIAGLILFNLMVNGMCEEFEEESKLGYDYIQIFRNMPTLFEYFLDVLQTRVEILERNDLRPYQESSTIDERDNNIVKREIDPCEAENNVTWDEKFEDESMNKDTTIDDDGGKYKRQITNDDFIRDVVTEVHEYGRGYTDVAWDEKFEDESMNKETTVDDGAEYKRQIINDDYIRDVVKNVHEYGRGYTANPAMEYNDDKIQVKRLDKSEDLQLKKYIEKHLSNMISNAKNYNKGNMKALKNNNIKFGKDFPGVNDWSTFYLSPEEVEEKAVETEYILEEHNKKNRKK